MTQSLSIALLLFVALVGAKLVPCSSGVDGVSNCFCVPPGATKCDAASAQEFINNALQNDFNREPNQLFGFSPMAGTISSKSFGAKAQFPFVVEAGPGCGVLASQQAGRNRGGGRKRKDPFDYNYFNEVADFDIVNGIESGATVADDDDHSNQATLQFQCAPFLPIAGFPEVNPHPEPPKKRDVRENDDLMIAAWRANVVFGDHDAPVTFFGTTITEGLCCIPDDDGDDTGPTGAPGAPGAVGAAGGTGAVGATGETGATGAPGTASVCSVALTGSNTAVITIEVDGSCTLAPSKKRDVEQSVSSVQARVSASLAYKRHGHHGDESSSSGVDALRCGPHVSLLIDGVRVFKSSDVAFEALGVVSGAVDVLLNTGAHTFELDVETPHCGEHRVSVENELIEVTILQTGLGAVVGGVQAPTLLQK